MDFCDHAIEVEGWTDASPSPPEPARADALERAARAMIAATGDDPDREGLADTPSRVARA